MRAEYHEVTRRLREEREKLGWTQIDICRKVYMSQGHYCKAELGKNRFTHSELQYLVKAGIDLHYVYTGEKVINPEYYEFFSGCDCKEMQCLAEMALPLIAYCAQDLPEEKAKEMQERVKYIKCILMRNRQEDNCFFQLRRHKGYSQRDMAGLLGVDIKKYCALENSRNFGDSEILLQMYNCFHLSPLILLNDESGLVREICGLLDQLEDETAQILFEHLKSGYNKLIIKR